MKRTFTPQAARSAVPIDLIDGGTLGVYPMSFDESDAYVKLAIRTVYARDDKGSILYNQKTGEPVKEYGAPTEDEVSFALGLIAYVKNLQLEDETPLELVASNDDDKKAIRDFLTQLNTVEIPLDSKGNEFIEAPGQVLADGSEKQPKSFRGTEVLYRTVIRESARLRRELNKLQRKNS